MKLINMVSHFGLENPALRSQSSLFIFLASSPRPLPQPSVPCQAVFPNNYNCPCHNWDISTKFLFPSLDNVSPVLEIGSRIKVSALWKMILRSQNNILHPG